jgi:plastocyanin
MTRLRSITLVASVGVAVALTACGATASSAPAGFHWYPSTPQATHLPSAASASASAAPSAAAASIGQGQPSGLGTAAVKVLATADLKFNPTTITAKVGDVVQWTNTGSVPHNVTFDDPTLTSGTLNQNDTWQVKITKAGTYSYKCTFHPGMNGQLTVG